MSIIVEQHTREACTYINECDECLSGKICIERYAHCNGTNSTPCKSHDTEPDGSVIAYRHAYDGELTSATRTWPGKVGYAVINIERYDDSEPAEYYVPGWAGQFIESPDFCNHRNKSKAFDWDCWSCWDGSCNTKAHPECEPPF